MDEKKTSQVEIIIDLYAIVVAIKDVSKEI